MFHMCGTYITDWLSWNLVYTSWNTDYACAWKHTPIIYLYVAIAFLQKKVMQKFVCKMNPINTSILNTYVCMVTPLLDDFF